MFVSTLRQLGQLFLTNTKVDSSRGVGLTEKIAMFMETFGHEASNGEVKEHFQHSGSSVRLCFQEGLKYVHNPQLLYPTSKIKIENTAPTSKIVWAH